MTASLLHAEYRHMVASLSLDRIHAKGAQWLDQSRNLVQTLGGQVVTWGQPLVALSRDVFSFSKNELSRITQQFTSLFQEPASSAPATNDELYSPQGAKTSLDRQTKGIFSQDHGQHFHSLWPRKAYDLSLSETARLAHGVAAHVNAPPEKKQEFVRQVQSMRKQGGFDRRVFAQTHQVLNQFPTPSDTQLDG